jgi:hypothetical protein
MTTKIRTIAALAVAAAAAGVLLGGCGSGSPATAAPAGSRDAAAILRADGYTVTTTTTHAMLSQAQLNLGDVSMASGFNGSNAEQVIVTSGSPTAPICQSSQLCDPAYMASQIPSLDPGAQARADGLVLRITGTVAIFHKDGIPL